MPQECWCTRIPFARLDFVRVDALLLYHVRGLGHHCHNPLVDIFFASEKLVEVDQELACQDGVEPRRNLLQNWQGYIEIAQDEFTYER